MSRLVHQSDGAEIRRSLMMLRLKTAMTSTKRAMKQVMSLTSIALMALLQLRELEAGRDQMEQAVLVDNVDRVAGVVAAVVGLELVQHRKAAVISRLSLQRKQRVARRRGPFVWDALLYGAGLL
jgi:hypothetical protein